MLRLSLLIALLAAVLAACSSTVSDPSPGPQVTPPRGVEAADRLPAAEQRLRLVALPGYAPVGDFEDRTGCRVSVTEAPDVDRLVQLMFSPGRFDGALGMSDAMVRLIEGGAIAPINTRLVPRYEDVYDGLKDQPYNSVGGQMFALPVGRAANVLLYRRDKVPGTLPGLAAVLDPAQAGSFGGQIVVQDSLSNIAEAALWLARQRPELEITDPYELDRRQFNAVLEVLRLQEPYVERYWRTDADVLADFRSGAAIVGVVSQNAAGILTEEGHPEGPYQATQPREGSSGISPAWMVSADARNPGCMYRWLDHALQPATQTAVWDVAHVAPSNRRVCEADTDDTPRARRCEGFSAADDGFYEQTLFRTSPSRDCGDARGRVCVGIDDWRRAWASLAG